MKNGMVCEYVEHLMSIAFQAGHSFWIALGFRLEQDRASMQYYDIHSLVLMSSAI